MKIAALTMMYNEEMILPYFLKHYEDLYRIYVLYETDSTDRTIDLLRMAQNVAIIPTHIEGGINDIEKVRQVNDFIARLGRSVDWLYVLDSDEFIFPEHWEKANTFLSRQDNGGSNLVFAHMYQVYRHHTDKDLDPKSEPIAQRVHGDPEIWSTVQTPHRDCNAHYIKPIVIKPSAGFRYAPGNHLIADHTDVRVSGERYVGAHWQMADPVLAIDRRMRRKARISEVNRKYMMGFQHHNITEELILEECEARKDSPVIPELCRNSRD